MSAVEIVMPRLSDAMEEGTIVRWLKDVGDQVEVGDELVEVETDKATVIYEAEISGLLSAILVQAGEAQQLGGADRPDRRRGRRPAARTAGRSPRPSRAGARASWASTSPRCAAPARAGASGSPTSRRRPTARRPRRRRRRRPRRAPAPRRRSRRRRPAGAGSPSACR